MTAPLDVDVTSCSDLSDDDLADVAALLTVADANRSPGDPPVSPAHLRDDEATLATWERAWRANARDADGRLLGSAALFVEDREDNRHLAWVETAVLPDHRRGGIGTALLASLLPTIVEDGRTVVMGGTPEGTPGAAFAAALGFAVGLTEHRNRARTGELPVDLLRSWARGGAPGYSLLAVDGPIPDDLLEPFAALRMVMNEAPRGDLTMDDDDVTPDELRALHAAEVAKGTVRWTLVARHDASGELAGLTELLLPRHQRWRAVQDNTGVATAHRGNGLGRVLKATNALRLLDERPDALVIETWNAGVNEHMLAINHAMGFRAEAVQQIVEADTAPLAERLAVSR